MAINKKLKELYYQKLPDLQQMVHEIGDEDFADYEGPLLLHCWEKNYRKSEIKIMYVGQETNGWIGFLRPIDKTSLEHILQTYRGFRLGAPYDSVFFQAINFVNSSLNTGALNFIWNNVLKFGASRVGRPSQKIQDAELKYFRVLKAEIQITNPDAVLFFSGPNYDADIEARLPGVSFEECSKHPARAISRLSHPALPTKSYRTYHPNYLRKAGREDILAEIIMLLK